MKIVAAMMVKNEERLLPDCLASLEGVVDEIHIVDTGSDDRTVEIAKLYGAEVYHHPWQNNFSLHRNQSIDYAEKAGADFIIIIDADERIVKAPNFSPEAWRKWLKEEIDDKDYKAIAFVVNDYQDGKLAMNCNSARMFKAGYIQYENMIHNQPKFHGACVLNHFFTLAHVGYDIGPEKMRKKFFRTKGLLYKEMKENPDNPDLFFYLCQLYGHHGYDEKSRYWGEKYLELKDKISPDQFNNTIYFTLIRNYQEANMLDRAAELIQEAMREKPQDPDLASAMSDQGAMVRDNRLMAEGARRYIYGFEEYSNNPALKGGQFYFSMTDDVLTLNLYRLCIASLEEGMRCWGTLKPKIPTMPQSLLDELKMNISLIGMPQLMQDIPELMNTPERTAFDVRTVEL